MQICFTLTSKLLSKFIYGKCHQTLGDCIAVLSALLSAISIRDISRLIKPVFH